MKIDELRNLSLEARKARNKHAATIYQVVIGELERTTKLPTDEQVYGTVRKLIKAAEQFPVPDVAEIAVLQALLPAELSDDEIWSYIKDAATLKDAMFAVPAGVDKRKVSQVWNSRK